MYKYNIIQIQDPFVFSFMWKENLPSTEIHCQPNNDSNENTINYHENK